VKIRSAESRDSEKLVELFQQLGYANDVSTLAERLQTRFVGVEDQVFVAEAEDKILGALVVNYIRPLHEKGIWAMISALVVDQSIRSKGVGAALLEHTERHAIEIGCTHIELSSSESRTRAHEFYVRHGFAEVRKRFVRRYV
jgi:GNAT superfamily N-acetyltransferase